MSEIVTYSDFATFVPTSTDKAVGAVGTDNYAYCRPCITRLGKEWNDMKYITRKDANSHMYNCRVCGWRITQKRASNF